MKKLIFLYFNILCINYLKNHTLCRKWFIKFWMANNGTSDKMRKTRVESIPIPRLNWLNINIHILPTNLYNSLRIKYPAQISFNFLCLD